MVAEEEKEVRAITRGEFLSPKAGVRLELFSRYVQTY